MKYYMRIRKWIKTLSQYHITLYAANASFYIILSVFPTIMLIASLLPSFGIETEELLDSMKGLVPGILHPLMEKILWDMESNSTGILLSATAPVAIWSASGGIYCIRRGLNAIYGIRESRSFIRNRLNSMLYTVLLIFALVLTLVVNGFGKSIVSYMLKQSIPILKLLGSILRLRGLILLFILTALFTAMYCVFPNRKQSINFSLPGALFAALGWLIFTEGYSWYARFSGSYPILYGSLSTIAMGMVWLYVCISILFYGCVINIYIERR